MLYTRSNNKVNYIFLLSSKIGSGGEGTVYAVKGNPDICVKIYHEQKRTPELEAKLKAMIDAPPNDPTLAAGHYSICWPTNVVYEDEACTKFLGFTMPRIDKNTFKEYHLLCDKPGVTTSTCYRLEHFGTGFTYLHMYVVALNLASCVASIHAAGHAIGDLNDKNILVSTKDSKITIVDCDSFEIHAKDDNVFPCSVYMPEYSAPEVILHKDIKDRQESDRFALSILIFKLLMLNTHPYASRGSSVEHLNTPGEKIAQGYYPYEEYADLDVNPPAYALPYDIIPPNIRALFRRCFVEGQHEPEQRPSAMEWFSALKDNFLEISQKLRDKPQCEKNHLHNFPLHLIKCPWCLMKDDYFPNRFVKKQTKKVEPLPKEFYYIETMMNQFIKDNKLSKYEVEQLYQSARRKKLPIEKIDNLIQEKLQTSSTLIVGDEPIFKVVAVNTVTANFEIYNLEITNNFLYNSITVELHNTEDYVTFSPASITILPHDTNTIQITLISEKVAKLPSPVSVSFTITAQNYSKKKRVIINPAAQDKRISKALHTNELLKEASVTAYVNGNSTQYDPVRLDVTDNNSTSFTITNKSNTDAYDIHFQINADYFTVHPYSTVLKPKESQTVSIGVQKNPKLNRFVENMPITMKISKGVQFAEKSTNIYVGFDTRNNFFKVIHAMFHNRLAALLYIFVINTPLFFFNHLDKYNSQRTGVLVNILPLMVYSAYYAFWVTGFVINNWYKRKNFFDEATIVLFVLLGIVASPNIALQDGSLSFGFGMVIVVKMLLEGLMIRLPRKICYTAGTYFALLWYLMFSFGASLYAYLVVLR